MLWTGDRSKIVVVYRNLATNENFEGNLQQVPTIIPTDIQGQKFLKDDAKNYIGDYAPTRKKMNQEVFLSIENAFGSPKF
jgi:hypothetical protein